MTVWKKGKRLTLVSLLVVVGCTAPATQTAVPHPIVVQNDPPSPQVAQPITANDNPFASVDQATAAMPAYTADEIHTFLAKAKAAEKIANPLQRCLAYPDPPHSHWPHDAVVAYCHYRWQPLITWAQVRALIKGGHAAELDKRLAAALHAQQTQPNSRGLLDQIYKQDFSTTSADERAVLDAWKRDSPNSAFAYAASGSIYVDAASDARGSDYASKTPQARLDAMTSLLLKADSDLRQAIALEPKITPAYVALIQGGNMGMGEPYLKQVVRQAIDAVPSDYSIYSILMQALQPKWHGSFGVMKNVAEQAQSHAAGNPLLKLLLSEEPFYKVESCGCDAKIQAAAYPAVFDQLGSTAHMWSAADAAADNERPEITVVLLSEVFRFLPSNPLASHGRAERSIALTLLGEPRWALTEATRAVAADPHYEGGFRARAMAYESLRDFPHAIEALKSTIAVDGDSWQLIELGNVYIYQMMQWDNGWNVANQLIQKYPDSPNGWILRAAVQVYQPRAGLKETYDQLATRFGKDPRMQETLKTMHGALVMQSGPGGLNSTKAKPLH